MATLIGTSRNDELIGSPEADLLQGLFGADFLYGDAGNDTLEGGDGDFDQLVGGAGDDLLDGGSGVQDYAYFEDAPGPITVDLGAGTATGDGNDTLLGIESVLATRFDDRLTGSTSANTLRGFAGNDWLQGMDGRDLLVGDEGNDTLEGGAGDGDDLSGGAGDDWLDGGAGELDEVDFATANGPVVVDLEAGTATGEGNDTLRGFEGINGSRHGDTLDGSAGRDALYGSNGSDLVRGHDGDDALYGDAGNDTLLGGAGESDFLRGGTGDDWLDGGDGASDLVTFIDASFAVVVDLEAGTARGDGNDTLQGIEHVEASAFSDVVNGNALDNILVASFGHDLLRGRGGDDRLIGALGNDTLEGGEDIDTAVYGGDFAGYRIEYAAGVVTVIDLDMGSEVGEFDSTDTLWEVEQLEFRDRSVTVEELFPDPQADELFDLRGVAAGRAAGRAGNDIYLVDGADDQLSEASAAGHDRVEASVSWALASHFEDLRLLGMEPLQGTGNEAANRLRGNSAANRLDGVGGNDTLAGDAGADTLLGGADDDTYQVGRGDRIIEAADAGDDVVLSAVSWILPAHLETLVLTGSRAVNGTGSRNANTLTGNVAANRLTGRDGDDSLAGRGGEDWLDGGRGNDTLHGGPGADVFVFAQAPQDEGNRDLLSDFTPGKDTIYLDALAFAGLAAGALDPARFLAGSVASTPEQRILYDRDSGALYYDADGNGANPARLFAVLGAEQHPALEATDFIIGA